MSVCCEVYILTTNPRTTKSVRYFGYFLILRRYNTLLGIGSGYPCFFMSLVFIGACTAVIGDVAGHLGCFINLKDSVNAIAFVALGTSVPGTVCAQRSNPHRERFSGPSAPS